MKVKKITLAVCVMAMLPLSSFANSNYWVSASGAKWRSADGQCIRSGSWNPANGLVEGCDKMPVVPERIVEVVQKPETIFVQPQEVVYEEKVHFGFDSAELTMSAKEKLDDLVRHAQHGSLVEVIVTGHADRIGTESYNMTLSQRRALSVRNYLVQKGVERLKITLDAKGESAPLVMCEGKMSRKDLISCLAPNRRADVTVRVFQ